MPASAVKPATRPGLGARRAPPAASRTRASADRSRSEPASVGPSRVGLALVAAAVVAVSSGVSTPGPALAATPPAPVERKKGKVKINKSPAKVKNFAEQGIVSVPDVPALPGASYKKGGASTADSTSPASSGGPSFSVSLPSFGLPSFSAPSVNIDGSADGKTQALAVLGAEVVAAGLATATVGALTKE